METNGQNQPDLFPSCACTEAKWACMSRNPQWGLGVFSWHKTETAARYNAEAIGGWAIAVGKDGMAAVAVAERIVLCGGRL
jgi:hypothetical protein